MSISVRTRFEVFKRDRFTCSYCGRTPPEVLLEADHIIPRAAGGSDDIANLTTACATCNRGKAARLLEEGTAPVVGRATVEELAERLEQGKAYMELLGGLASLVDRQHQMVIDAWAKAFGAVPVEKDDGTYWSFDNAYGNELWPNEHSIKRFLRGLSFEGVLDAVSIAAEKMGGQPGQAATRYFYGVCNRSIREGRAPGSPRQEQPEPPKQSAPEQSRERLAEIIRERIEGSRLAPFFLDEDLDFDPLTELLDAVWPETSA